MVGDSWFIPMFILRSWLKLNEKTQKIVRRDYAFFRGLALNLYVNELLDLDVLGLSTPVFSIASSLFLYPKKTSPARSVQPERARTILDPFKLVYTVSCNKYIDSIS